MTDSYVVLDLETSGLYPKSDYILEIGAIKVKEGRIIDTFSTFVDAGVKISAPITNLTGITNKMTDGAMPTDEAVKNLVDFCDNLIIMGHNVIFDYSFIKRNAVNYNLTFDKKGIDTLKIARKTLPHLEKRSLEFLCNYYNIQQDRKHRAFDDAMATFELYNQLVKDFGDSDTDAFIPYDLVYQVKKEGPITKFQKTYLIDLIKYHKIVIDYRVDTLTKNQASRKIDQIILMNGRIKR